MTYCRHCRRGRSLDERIPLHLLLLMFLVLMLVLLSGELTRQARVRDCGEGPAPAARTGWPAAFETVPAIDTHRNHRVCLHDTYGVRLHDAHGALTPGF